MIKLIALKTTFTEKAKTMENNTANKESQTTAFPIEMFQIPRYSDTSYFSKTLTTLTGSTTFNTIAIIQISHRITLNIFAPYDRF